MSTLPGPDVDRSFAGCVASRTPTPYRHDLAEHPLLEVEAIAGPAERLGPESISALQAAKPVLDSDPEFLALTADAVAERIRTLTETESWFTLLNIEQDPRYAALVNDILDGVADRSGMPRAALRRRMGFVFASSPGAVTAAHFDTEHSLLFQVRGRRTLSFGRFRTPTHRESEVRRLWRESSFGRMAVMPEPVSEVALEPGAGAYIPPFTPHWITNGDAPSSSLTVTFYERSNQAEVDVQVLNERLRSWGLRPRAYGTAPVRDRAKAAAMRGYAALRRRDGEVSRPR